MVAKAFGSQYLTAEGELNRPKISELVFHDKEALRTLEGILHKIVWKRLPRTAASVDPKIKEKVKEIHADF